MGEFLSTQFSIHNMAGQIMFALLQSALVRMVTWVYRVPLQGAQISVGGGLA
jgi:hypothetical protein